MSKVFIVGATGKVGRRVGSQLVARGHQVTAMHRSPEQGQELRSLGALPVVGSLLELDTCGLSMLMAGSDVVLFSAGAGGAGMELTNAIDGRGLELSVEAANIAGVKRFILVSAFPEALRGGKISDGFENYIAVKKRSDIHLAETDLDWVILRPGTLVDSPGTGKVRAGLAIPYGDVARDDVAATIVEIIEQPKINRVIIELTQGDTPVGDAVRQLSRN
ncbi:SDR family oxidoreductase [Rhizobium leguminosarum]|uniref:SDR family oxidoreductase n=1 Tax=Rhizobium leguminosarum TaxID=384 RepID=UPI00143F642B|nr:SDR family oxidoreductase [Rhizobium leguminosarum]NKL21251.1 NAD(P)H-binding protein [Rhizobium leguminosarum bv. viciae]NKL56758.1 NAD(P)H-binding protein [Rhizobium leguminosarum bv. viciae]